MAMIDSVYQYYLSTYGPENTSRYDTHKKSELRETYNNIIKANKESPLYKIKEEDVDVKKFAIDIKENARNIKNVIASLSEYGDDITELFNKKVAVSDRPTEVGVTYIGSSDGEDSAGFTIDVKQLATTQKNCGNFLRMNTLSFAPGSYSFDLATTSNTYEFQFNVNDRETNYQVQQKLARLINHAGIGLQATIQQLENGTASLNIESKRTGLGTDGANLFEIRPQSTGRSMYSMDLLGINQITSPATNSVFLLNGKEHSSYANTFTINNAFEVTLKHPTEERPATIEFKANGDAVADSIQNLADAYNNIIQTASNYKDTAQNSHLLLSDMSQVAEQYRSNFADIGLYIKPDHSLALERDILKDATEKADAVEKFQVVNHFKSALQKKADKASIDPMSYVDKVVVAYKNPGHNFPTPYISSMYSGMMVDKDL